GDVYACPFVMHDAFKGGSVRDPGGFAEVWHHSPTFLSYRDPHDPTGACSSCEMYDACRGGCMATKFFTGLPLDGPDPECVNGHGEVALLRSAKAGVERPHPGTGHSKPVRVELGSKAGAVTATR
ncbi:MAG: SPASM domain-containing protein, partial [Actinobacteria bacterium]|nr:SPASM domain-containing protein [Actinomycetota bacterium]